MGQAGTTTTNAWNLDRGGSGVSRVINISYNGSTAARPSIGSGHQATGTGMTPTRPAG